MNAEGSAGYVDCNAWLVMVLLAAACISLLQLLEPTDAWIDPTQRLLQQYQAPAPKLGSGRRPAGDGSCSFTHPGRRQQSAGEDSRQVQSSEQALQQQQAPRWQQQQQGLPAVLALADLQQEAAVFTAGAALLQKGKGLDTAALMGYTLDVGWLFEQLVFQGLFGEAIQLVHVVYSGQQLLQQLELLIANVANQCADLQRNSQQLGADTGSMQQGEGFDDSSMGAAGSSKAAGVLRRSVLTPIGPSYLCSEAATAWSKLRRVLEDYDSFDCLSPDAASGAAATAAAPGAKGSSTGSAGSSRGLTLAGARLRLAAVDGALSAHPRLALPAWLLQPFLPTAGAGAGMAGSAADPAALLRKLIEHWRLVDAAELVLSYLDAWQQQSPLQRVHSTAVWLPLQDMELLHASLQGGARRAREKGAAAEAAVLDGCAEGLEGKLKQHVSLVRDDWNQLQQRQ